MKYEFTALIDKKDLEPAIEAVHKAIESVNGRIISEDIKTNHKLAYKIRDIEECSMVNLDLELDGIKDCNKIAEKFNKEMTIIRYILCKAAKQ